MPKKILASSGLIAALLGTQCALPAEEDGGALTEVVVTAQRREESSQRAPIAIQALGADQFTGTTEAPDLSKRIPAIQIGPSQAPQPLVYLRGVGSLTGNSLNEPAVIFSLDGVPLARPYQGARRGAAYAVQPAYWLSDASFEYKAASGVWSLTAFINNISDRTVLATTFADPFNGIVGPPLYFGQLQAPRTYGARVHVNF